MFEAGRDVVMIIPTTDPTRTRANKTYPAMRIPDGAEGFPFGFNLLMFFVT
jgi:hypothetical protein